MGSACHRQAPGFTLLEVLVVMALMALMAGLAWPALGALWRASQVRAVQMQFSRYAAGFEVFRLEHGFYPSPGDSGIWRLPEDAQAFLECLGGRAWELDRRHPEAVRLNPEGRVYIAFREDEVRRERGGWEVLDASGNTRIRMVVDRDGAGRVSPERLEGLESENLPPYLRCGVALYTLPEAEKGPWIKSWP